MGEDCCVLCVADKRLHVPRPDSRPSVSQRQPTNPAWGGFVRGSHHGRTLSPRLFTAKTPRWSSVAAQRYAAQPLGERQRHWTYRQVGSVIILAIINIIIIIIFYYAIWGSTRVKKYKIQVHNKTYKNRELQNRQQENTTAINTENRNQ